jgi:hypothetical protein
MQFQIRVKHDTIYSGTLRISLVYKPGMEGKISIHEYVYTGSQQRASSLYRHSLSKYSKNAAEEIALNPLGQFFYFKLLWLICNSGQQVS